MATFVKVGTTADVKPGQVKLVEAGGRKIALCNVDGQFYALDDACPHEGKSMAAGDVEGDRLVCVFHGAAFNVATGELEDGPRCANLPRYEVRVSGSDIEVAV